MRDSADAGFSLLELIIYIAIASVMLVLIVTLYRSLISARVKHQTISEVESQGLEAMTIITQAIRSAYSISSPATSTSAALLSINPTSTSTNPTIFDVASSTLRITENGGAPVALTNSQAVVTGLLFQNYSRAGTLGSMKVTFRLSHATTSATRSDTSNSQIFYGSATIRRIAQ